MSGRLIHARLERVEIDPCVPGAVDTDGAMVRTRVARQQARVADAGKYFPQEFPELQLRRAKATVRVSH
jgi:hypothetical protein